MLVKVSIQITVMSCEIDLYWHISGIGYRKLTWQQTMTSSMLIRLEIQVLILHHHHR